MPHPMEKLAGMFLASIDLVVPIVAAIKFMEYQRLLNVRSCGAGLDASNKASTAAGLCKG